MAYKKFIKRVAKKVGRVVKKRYFKGKGYSRPRIGQMIQDVRFLKSIVNAEKHKQVYASTNNLNTVSQVNGNASGAWIADITPNLSQGVGVADRVGSSIKWHASHWSFQFVQQTNSANVMKLKIVLALVKGKAQSSVVNVLANMYDANPFVSGGAVYDYHSPRNQDEFKNYVILKQKIVKMERDNLTSQNNIVNVNFGYKFKNHHVKWDGNTATIVDGQVCMFIFADSGNASTSTSCTLGNGVPYVGTSTGCTFQYIQTHYYYDN